MRQTPVALTVAGVLCASISLLARSPQAPAFEAASVRPNPQGNVFNSRVTDTRVEISRPLGMIVLTAFRLTTEYRLIAPSWLKEVFVDIQATLPSGATRQQVPEMLQRLLVERFGLAIHRESRLMDAYELSVAPDGMKMRAVEPLDELGKEFPAARTCPTCPSSDRTGETPDGPIRTMSIPGGFRQITSRTLWERTANRSGGGTFTATRMTMAELLPFLEANVDGPIVDRTGLTGVYQFTLELPRDAMLDRIDAELRARLGASQSLETPTGGSALSVFKELAKLGLTLERRRLPVEVIVVDRIARTPTEN